MSNAKMEEKFDSERTSMVGRQRSYSSPMALQMEALP
jgi:hypothetical protein